MRKYEVLDTYDLDEDVLGNNGVFYKSLVVNNKGYSLDNTDFWRQMTAKPLTTSLVFNVPTDFLTVNEAIEHITRCYYPTGGNISARILLGTGYQMNEQVFVIGLNLGWIEIVGVDGVTVTNANLYTQNSPSNLKPLFYGGNGATLPKIGQQFTMINGSVTNGNHGILLEWNSNVSFNGFSWGEKCWRRWIGCCFWFNGYWKQFRFQWG